MELQFNCLAIGEQFQHLGDARRPAIPKTSKNVFVKVSATKYRPLSGEFTGRMRYPSSTVATWPYPVTPGT